MTKNIKVKLERRRDIMNKTEEIDAWLDFRSDCMEFTKKLHETALKKYLDRVGIKDVFAYEYSYDDNKFTIYTKYPGIWIGKGGQGVDLLKEILSEDVAKNCNVCFKEIRGNFISYK
jgi:ribosomal protein S3